MMSGLAMSAVGYTLLARAPPLIPDAPLYARTVRDVASCTYSVSGATVADEVGVGVGTGGVVVLEHPAMTSTASMPAESMAKPRRGLIKRAISLAVEEVEAGLERTCAGSIRPAAHPARDVRGFDQKHGATSGAKAPALQTLRRSKLERPPGEPGGLRL